MTQRERVHDYLRQIAPESASEREIAAALGIRWRRSVYNVAQQLVNAGEIVRERRDNCWRYSAKPVEHRHVEPATEGAGQAAPMGEAEPSQRGAQRRAQLARLLTDPEGRAWFLERVRCPCTPSEARAAEVRMHCRPLRALLLQDYGACGGVIEAQERLAATYNACLRLSDDCGIGRVWRAEHPGKMRLPLSQEEGGWTPKLLRKHIANKRYLKRALAAPRLVRTRVDALLVVGRQVVLVRCADDKPITRRRYVRLQGLGGALERRLGQHHFLAAVVDGPDQLAVLAMAHVRWAELNAWLEQHAEAAQSPGGTPQPVNPPVP